MIYFFYGDSKKAGEKAKNLVDSLLKKKPDASIFVLNDENCKEEVLQELTQSSALFENKYIVRMKNVLNDITLGSLKEMKNSENIFVWSEDEVKKTDLKNIEKNSEKIVEVVSISKKETTKGNEIFEICEPIINRDKKKLWTKYQELLEKFSTEEIHGTIFWQFKNIAIVHNANQKESGLAPFPYSQAKKATTKYSEREVLEKTAELVSMIHEARIGGSELSILLEKFILNI